MLEFSLVLLLLCLPIPLTSQETSFRSFPHQLPLLLSCYVCSVILSLPLCHLNISSFLLTVCVRSLSLSVSLCPSPSPRHTYVFTYNIWEKHYSVSVLVWLILLNIMIDASKCFSENVIVSYFLVADEFHCAGWRDSSVSG